MDYKAKFTGIGEMASEFLSEKFLIVFNNNAPAELAEISYTHTIASLDQDVKPGDVVIFGTKQYIVTAVGEEANQTLRNMGHCTFSFEGKDTVTLPGHIQLKGDSVPSINIGDSFEILFT